MRSLTWPALLTTLVCASGLFSARSAAPASVPPAGNSTIGAPPCTQSAGPGHVIGGLIEGIAVIDDHDIWAVGAMARHSMPQPLVVHWDGRSWAVVPSPGVAQGPSELFAVTALSATDIWAVGTTNIPGDRTIGLAEHWDGRVWRIIPTPQSTMGGGLTVVAAANGSAAWAAGRTESIGPYGQVLPTIEQKIAFRLSRRTHTPKGIVRIRRP